MAGTRDK